MNDTKWPDLRYSEWSETYRTIHLWTQIIGKVRLSKLPWTNHSWHSTLYVTERGLTTNVIHDENCSFSMELDFLNHTLNIRKSNGRLQTLSLQGGPVSLFYNNCIQALKELEIEAAINVHPNELPVAVPFTEDHEKRPYDPDYANRFWHVMMSCDRVFKNFSSFYLGKVSPVHFFWGSFDLAVTRFSGRRAPEHPGGIPNLPDLVTREAYSHEVSSCGFWPGNEQFPHAAFYSYAYPTPEGFNKAQTVSGAYFEPNLQEFILPYEVVQHAENPDQLIFDFCQSAYEAAANLSNWDRKLLEESEYLDELRNRSSHGRTVADLSGFRKSRMRTTSLPSQL